MSTLTLQKVHGYLSFDESECRSAGRALATVYKSALPFPHIVLDDFIELGLLRQVHASFPPVDRKRYFDRAQERLKFQFNRDEIKCGVTRNLLAELNGSAFLTFLRELTGIEGLVSDPYFVGGGLHMTQPGGHLGVHADFNVHSIMKLERRINLIIYLNENWREEYGGHLELWNSDMTSLERRIAPVIGRAVIFNTTVESFHGHPNPLTCPEGRDRRSIATYYYTAFDGGLGSIPKRSTNFKPRPGTSDRIDHSIRLHHFINDWVPPRLQALARRFNPFT